MSAFSPATPGSSDRAAALTPRPRRLLLIGAVDPDSDRQVREIQAQFPNDAAAEAGVSAVESFIGSGFMATMLEIDADDVQDVLSAYFNHPSIREFHSLLNPLVSGFPDGSREFGAADHFHDASEPAETDTARPMTSADLPMAASMFRWRAGEEPDLGRVPQRPRDR